MKRKSIHRLLSIFVGIIFLASGFMKLLDVSAFQNLIIQYGLYYFQYLAPLIVLLEIFLGLSLFLDVMQRTTAILSLCLLLIFTGVYTYGYLVNSVEDCGCFADFVKSTPTITYLRNIVLICILVFIVFIDKRTSSYIVQWKLVTLLSVMIPSIFAAGMTFRIERHNRKTHPFEGKNVSETPLKRYVETDDKSKLVFFMSYQCKHCWNSIENYKAYVENSFVDTALCFALCTNQSNGDSISLFFKKSYPEINSQEVIRDSVAFVEATPTAFFIENNRVTKIITGGLPSPFLLFKEKQVVH